MKAQRLLFAAVILAVLGTFSIATRPQANAQAENRAIGRYQISSFPGRPAQFGLEMNGPGCYCIDTATGELWTYIPDANQKFGWKRVSDGIR